MPRDLILFEGAFTRENGLLTESNKPARPHLKAQFGPQLDAMFEAASSRQFKDAADFRSQDLSGWSTRDKVLHAVGIVLGIDRVAKREDASFTQLGGDSIAAVTLGELLGEVWLVALFALAGIILQNRVPFLISFQASAQLMEQTHVDLGSEMLTHWRMRWRLKKPAGWLFEWAHRPRRRGWPASASLA